VPPGGSFTDEGLSRRARIVNRRLDTPPSDWRDLLLEIRESSGGTADWEEALAALQDDPEAAIPGE